MIYRQKILLALMQELEGILNGDTPAIEAELQKQSKIWDMM